MKELQFYLESSKFERSLQNIDEGITSDLLKFPFKDIFQTFNTLSRDQRKAVLELLSAAENKKLSWEDRKNALTDLKEILLKKNPTLIKQFL